MKNYIALGITAGLALGSLANASNVYMQSNTLTNQVIHFRSNAKGVLVELNRTLTHGKGTGGFKPVTGEKDAPNDFESVSSVILSDDHHFLFVTNGGNNTVSSFNVKPNGDLTWVDTKATGQTLSGKFGTANSLAYDSSRSILYVSHIFGPDHIHLLKVSRDGHLSLTGLKYSVNTKTLSDRLPTQILLTPDHRFLIANVLFDKRPSVNPDGSANLAISNSKEKNGIVVFPVQVTGALSRPEFQDAGGLSPFFTGFFKGSNDTFYQLFAVSDGVMIGHIDATGKISTSRVVPIDNSAGKPSEICWASLTPDNRYLFTANLAYSTVSSYEINGHQLNVLHDPVAPAVRGDGTFHAIDGQVTSSPVDNWISSDGKYFYQIYPNASTLVTYQIGARGALREAGRTVIPRNTSQGLAGF